MLRLNGLSITVLYERGRRQQVTIPSALSGRIQRWKEIPKVTRNQNADRQRRQIHGHREDSGIQWTDKKVRRSSNEERMADIAVTGLFSD